MKRFIVILVLITVTTSCGIIPTHDLTSKESQVSEYNVLVEDTLLSYTTIRGIAEREKENLLAFVLRGTPWNFIKEDSVVILPESFPVTGEFFDTYFTRYDEYFTAVGSDSLREVISLQSDGVLLYLTVVWKKDRVVTLQGVLTG